MTQENSKQDERWMTFALSEAGKAFERDEVPVGAVLVRHGDLITSSYNQIITLSDPTAHAEILAIRQACSILDNYRLNRAVLYITLEPCMMCADAIVQARIDRLVYGASSPKFGYTSIVPDFFTHSALNHRVEVTAGVKAEECGEVLKKFFAEKRGGEDEC
ncbi:tRNA adenosine(34) deaminase TadA [Acidobacteriota bacterium]